MRGSAIEVIVALVTAVAGVWLVTATLMGFGLRKLDPITRTGYFVAGVALLVPSGAFQGGGFVDIAGAALAVFLVGRDYVVRSRESAARTG
ncbi:MAG: C4-dicarboxylate ABC transporter permease, partial [Alphaproteobacteria bacterium]|nr:C4-dicarboxylate ABC transporter permease [Alphaproteobacteria bacterium]